MFPCRLVCGCRTGLQRRSATADDAEVDRRPVPGRSGQSLLGLDPVLNLARLAASKWAMTRWPSLVQVLASDQLLWSRMALWKSVIPDSSVRYQVPAMSVAQVIVELTRVRFVQQGRCSTLPPVAGRSLVPQRVLLPASGQDRRRPGRGLPTGRPQVRVWTRRSPQHRRSRRPHLPLPLVPLVPRCSQAQKQEQEQANWTNSVRSRNQPLYPNPWPTPFPRQHQHQQPNPGLRLCPRWRLCPRRRRRAHLFPSRVLLQP